jgi:hypothetical protein
MSKHKSATLLIILIVISAFWIKKPLGLPLLQKLKPLHQIKKLYIVDSGTWIVKTHDAQGSRLLTKEKVREFAEEQKARYHRMTSLLEQELTRVGFEVVKDIRDADAELVGIIGARASTPPDWPRDWPPPRRYVYRLVLPENGKPDDFYSVKGNLWETDSKMSSKIVADEGDKQAASKVADNLLKAWLQSAKKAGISVGDKVQ